MTDLQGDVFGEGSAGSSSQISSSGQFLAFGSSFTSKVTSAGVRNSTTNGYQQFSDGVITSIGGTDINNYWGLSLDGDLYRAGSFGSAGTFVGLGASLTNTPNIGDSSGMRTIFPIPPKATSVKGFLLEQFNAAYNAIATGGVRYTIKLIKISSTGTVTDIASATIDKTPGDATSSNISISANAATAVTLDGTEYLGTEITAERIAPAPTTNYNAEYIQLQDDANNSILHIFFE